MLQSSNLISSRLLTASLIISSLMVSTILTSRSLLPKQAQLHNDFKGSSIFPQCLVQVNKPKNLLKVALEFFPQMMLQVVS